MSKYLIEVSHGDGPHACRDAVEALLHTGAHFMVNADWGCMDDVHKAWLMVEADSKDELRLIIPPHYRSDVRIVQLTKYNSQELQALAGGNS